MQSSLPIDVARRVLQTEIDGLLALSDKLGDEFSMVVDQLSKLSGHVILAGVGKSGHVARKIAATLASTGTPSLFIHPTEASHGDMGMIKKGDVVIALSRSGETQELADITRFCKRFDVTLIAITCMENSTLAKACDILLLLPDAAEACNITGAPTTSTILQMALGDALAVALLELRGFTAGDFKTFHPGGNLGAQLTFAQDIMHTGNHVPLVGHAALMDEALTIMSDKGFGCVGITDQAGQFIGMITDGDIRRNLHKDLPNLKAKHIMTTNPKTVTPQTLAVETLKIMTASPPKVMQIFVLLGGEPIGIIHMHDLLRAGLV
ncbi:MAG: KpsF/GutQ family sugar-phosphate isomerase [Robiginitomaculum sp.]|nr:KpsF/GutQ family sugar-phosphate isomerase [Robiginitomaculum sp.]